MSTPEQPSCKDIVLGVARRPTRRVVVAACTAALALHVGAGAVALAITEPSDRPLKRESKPMVVVDHVVELEPPAPEEPPPPPPPPPVEEKEPPRPKLKPVKAPPAPPAPKVAEPPPEAPEPPPEKPPSEPPPAAQAGQVVAAEQAATDKAAFNIATGQGNSYAGGTTTASGTGTQANHTGQVGNGNGNGLSRARPPQLRARAWDCGWPPEAEDLDLEEAFVKVRVSIDAKGGFVNAEVLADPGHGFGRRAQWCARKQKYEPALDAAGNPVAGTTPILNVRFTRDE